MITQEGFYKEWQKITFKKYELFINGKPCKSGEKIKIPTEYAREFQNDSFCFDVKVQFSTPLRIKKNNRFLRSEDLELFDILNSIHQRDRLIRSLGHEKVEAKGKIIEKNLYHKKLTRYSNKQKTKMRMDGLMGEIKITNLDKNGYDLLRLGEIIGIGKQTVMGLGKIKVEDEK